MNPTRRTIGELTFLGGFHLTSSDKRLGGLSGVDVLDDGNLLAISDDGDFVWIDLAPDGILPVAGRLAGMRDADGRALRGKADADAEGLALNDGVALVSFERTHRVLAYDLAGCGAAARGAPVIRGKPGLALNDTFARQSLAVNRNSGVEALAATSDWFLLMGVEQMTGEASAVSARAIEGEPEFDLRVGSGGTNLVGMDVLPAGEDALRVFTLHRSTSPLASKAILLRESRFERELDQSNLPARRISEIDERSHMRFRMASSQVLAEMNLFVTIDNFEGVAARLMPDGRVRLYVVSDDNFAARQRTLLMVYELAG
jgi:hypothetical protein